MKAEHAPQNALTDPDDVARFYDRCSDLMRELLDALAAAPGRPRTFPQIEEAIGWPRRRIASVLGGVSHLRHTEFGGRRPYRFHDERQSASGRWEMWMDADQARAVRAAQLPTAPMLAIVPAMETRILRREDGETITALERRDVLILAERRALTVTWTRYAAGERGPGPHVHRQHVDAFYVLEGEVAFTLGPDGEPVSLPAGGFVAVPPNVVHSFANESDADATWLNFHAPDMGFAAFLRAARDGRPGPWDSFDPPADGGRPATEAIVTRPGSGERVLGDLPELRVAASDAADRPGLYYELGAGALLGVHAPR